MPQFANCLALFHWSWDVSFLSLNGFLGKGNLCFRSRLEGHRHMKPVTDSLHCFNWPTLIYSWTGHLDLRLWMIGVGSISRMPQSGYLPWIRASRKCGIPDCHRLSSARSCFGMGLGVTALLFSAHPKSRVRCFIHDLSPTVRPSVGSIPTSPRLCEVRSCCCLDTPHT